ncbi:hypothetical protein GNF98_17295 [Clostridium perfringens]
MYTEGPKDILSVLLHVRLDLRAHAFYEETIRTNSIERSGMMAVSVGGP